MSMRLKPGMTALWAYVVCTSLLVGSVAEIGTAAQAQVFNAPRGEVENVRFEQLPSGVINISYDLVSDDARALFAVVLEVSSDGGGAFGVTPKTVSGDVGNSVTPGLSKRIVWDAPKDGFTNIRVEQFRFRVVARAGRAVAGVGSARVSSTPAGAVVIIDGVERGKAPMTVSDLSVGAHDVVLRMPGYLDTKRDVDVKAGETATVSGTLTKGTPDDTTAPTTTNTAMVPTEKKKGVNKLVWVGLGVGGAAAVGLAAAGGGGGAGGGNTGGGNTGGGTPPPAVTCTSFTASRTLLEFSVDGGALPFDVAGGPAGCTGGTASFSGLPSWVRLSTTTVSGPTNSVTATAESNTGTDARDNSFTLGSQTIRATQPGRPAPPPACTYRANFRGGDGVPSGSNNTEVPGDCAGPANCGRRTIDVQASASTCTWRVEGAPSWFAEVQNPPVGSGSIVFGVYQANTTGRDRTAEFFVAGVRFTVKQCAGRC